MSGEITFLKPLNVEDLSYRDKITSSLKFKRFIGKVSDPENVLIIVVDGINYGVVVPNVYYVSEAKHAEPHIYIERRSIYSQKIIFKMLYHLFFVERIDTLIIKIFSDNLPMITMMKNMEIKLSGMIKDVDKELSRDLLYFQLTNNEYHLLFNLGDSYV